MSFLKYLVVPASKNTKPYRSDSAFPMGIVAKTIEVLSTIELNHKVCLTTREIGNIATDRDLATKPKTRKLAPPQMSPEVLLSVRRLISKFACAVLWNRITHGLDYAPSPALPRALRKGGSVQRSLLEVMTWGSG